MKVIIDRFDGDCAIVEIDEGSFACLPAELVPKGAKEGSVIKICLDENASREREQNANTLMNKLFMEEE